MGTAVATEQDNKNIASNELVRRILNAPKNCPEQEIDLARQYCEAKNLDPLKKPLAIVPFKDTSVKGGLRFEIIPTIESIKTVASRANWAGNDDYVFGSDLDFEWQDRYKGKVTVNAPEWGQVTVYKIVGGARCAFVGPKVFFEERNAKNSNWIKQPKAMLHKCILAAALRNAFPEECGGMYIEEEGVYHAKEQEDQEKIPGVEAAKNEEPLTPEEEEALKKELAEMEAKSKKSDDKAKKTKPEPEEKAKSTTKKTESEATTNKKKEEPKEEVVEATAKVIEEEPTSQEIADSLIALIDSALESGDDDAVDFVIGEIDLYKTKKLEFKNKSKEYTTIDDHNRVAEKVIEFRKIKGIE